MSLFSDSKQQASSVMILVPPILVDINFSCSRVVVVKISEKIEIN
jgi:hypothetical protein